MTITRYILQSKDKPLIEFDLHILTEVIMGELEHSYSLQITAVHEENQYLFPKNLSETNNNSLLHWIQERRAPKNRQFVNQILAAYDSSESPISYIDISYGLSLNDSYWIINADFPRKWDDCNLYNHPFDEILAYVAFTGHSEKVSGVATSPEFTTDGMQKKCWSNRNDGIYLLKGASPFLDRGDGRNDVFCEYYASQVADAMGFKHVTYELEEFHHRNGEKELVTVCPLFTDEEHGYLPIYYLVKDRPEIIDADLRQIRTELAIADIYGLEAFQDMMVLDSIIYNVDRHLKNFGVIINNNNGEIIGPAPLFDHGMSLLIGASKREFENPLTYCKTIESKFNLDFDIQARRYVQARHLPKLRKLTGFTFKRHPRWNMPEEYLTMLEKIINKRGRKLINLFHEREKNNKRSR